MPFATNISISQCILYNETPVSSIGSAIAEITLRGRDDLSWKS